MRKYVVGAWKSVYALLFEDLVKSPIENRRLLSRSVGAGLFWCFTPTVFFQQPVIFAYWYAVRRTSFNVNLPVAWAWTWFSNPFTIIPLYYAYYWIGQHIVASDHEFHIDDDFSFSEAGLYGTYELLEPVLLQLLMGSLLVSGFFAALGYWGVYYFIGNLKRK